MQDPISPRPSDAKTLAELLRRAILFIEQNQELIDQLFAGNRAPIALPSTEVAPKPKQKLQQEPQQDDATPVAGADQVQPVSVPHPALPDAGPVLGTHEALAALNLSNGIAPRSSQRTGDALARPEREHSPLLQQIEPIAIALELYESALTALLETRRSPSDRSAAREWSASCSSIAQEDGASWLCDSRLTERLERDQIRVLKRRYRAGVASVRWWCALLKRSPEIARGAVEGQLKAEVTERLQAIATAQAGIRTEIDQLNADQPRALSCPVQTRLFLHLRSLIDRKQLAIFLDRMTRDATVEPAETEALIKSVEEKRAQEGRTNLRPTARIAQSETTNEPETQRFASVSQAFEAARVAFGGDGSGVVFTERASRSAADSPFLRPDEVYETLGAIFQAVQKWRESSDGAMGSTFKELLRAAGHDEKRCSEGTMSKNRNEYTMHHAGRTVQLSQHVTLGAGNANTCLSIHWWREESTRILVIGHCGRHLTNTLS